MVLNCLCYYSIMYKKFLDLFKGFIILIFFCVLSSFIVKVLHIMFPSAILGLILFAASLILGIIKEEWIKPTSEFLIKYMAMFIVPLMSGLVAYKALLLKNWLVILFVIFFTTTFIIVATGLFVDFGLKFLRLHKIRKLKNE